MKVTDAIAQSKYHINGRVPISFEIIPPKWQGPKNEEGSADKVKERAYRVMDSLMALDPTFVSVTYHQKSSSYESQTEGTYTATIENPRPGTIALCSKLEGKFGVPMVQHLVCGGFTEEETAACISEIAYVLDNVFVIRGDHEKGQNVFVPTEGGHRYASDLVRQVTLFNRGEYMQGNARVNLKTNLCIGVAGYPEMHPESPDEELDLEKLKEKVEAGAHYIITQMCFQPELYFRFQEKLRSLSITIPVIPGITPLIKPDDISKIPKIFGARFNPKTRKQFLDNPTLETSVEILAEEMKTLAENGAPCIHMFTESSPKKIEVITQAYRRIFGKSQ